MRYITTYKIFESDKVDDLLLMKDTIIRGIYITLK